MMISDISCSDTLLDVNLYISFKVSKKKSPPKNGASGHEHIPRGYGSANASYEGNLSNLSLGNSIDSNRCNDRLVYPDRNNGAKVISVPRMDERLRSHGGMLV
jgi:hypothetical protein